MPSKPNVIRVATSSLATLEATRPPFNIKTPDIDETIQSAISLVKSAAAAGADLVVLPETFAYAGLPIEAMIEDAVNPQGKGQAALRHICQLAAQYKVNIILGALLPAAAAGPLLSDLQDPRAKQFRNSALFVDRQGRIIARYHKRYPVESELAAGILPGDRCVVVESDIGRVGLAICFDLNWPKVFEEMKEKGVDLCVWISAYDGGFPLQACAATLQLPIVTSVMPYHAKYIDRLGRLKAQTSRWSRMLVVDVCLETETFHTDGQASKIQEIQECYGGKVNVESFSEEHLFVVEVVDRGVKMDDIISRFHLVTYTNYIKRCSKAVEDILALEGSKKALESKL
ncbi:hypothetical protein CYMTET_12329 [Cymbomonas tetramitiformis]|uniref:CN hydrolase domain-containing protein n=1 Tax=Cymbomonas tetramitiformis TaxID=36881 RepID=A0AAE0GK98_9CHLO|nr:hypothetical protein CYMTET_12329 [Cymbomonas tetramitiformis]